MHHNTFICVRFSPVYAAASNPANSQPPNCGDVLTSSDRFRLSGANELVGFLPVTVNKTQIESNWMHIARYIAQMFTIFTFFHYWLMRLICLFSVLVTNLVVLRFTPKIRVERLLFILLHIWITFEEQFKSMKNAVVATKNQLYIHNTYGSTYSFLVSFQCVLVHKCSSARTHTFFSRRFTLIGWRHRNVHAR